MIVIFSLYVSFKTLFALISLDADTAHSIMLWFGIKDHGIRWLNTWLFTPDNWLFSIVPFNFITFIFFGPEPFLVILSGWFVFVLAAVVSGLIAWELNAKRAAFLVPIVLLCLGHDAIVNGLAAYAASHNITNLYGLGSLLFFVKSIKSRKISYMLGIFILLLVGTLSDPWIIAAYIIPYLLLSVALLLFTPLQRSLSIQLILICLFVIAAARTHFFWLLTFLPWQAYQATTVPTIIHNSMFLVKDLGGFFDFIPLIHGKQPETGLISMIAIAGLAIVNLVTFFNTMRRFHSDVAILFCFIALSVASISGAFIVLSIPADSYSSRFLISSLYLIIIGFAVLADTTWDSSSLYLRALSTGLATLFFIVGLESTFPIWKTPKFIEHSSGAEQFVTFLEANELNYGYGSYHGSMSNAVTAISGGDIKLRPVQFSAVNGMMITGKRAESSRQWYTASDVPIGQKQFFVVLTSDGEECPNIDLCISGLNNQFGVPSRTLKYGPGATILVWNHSLLNFPRVQ